ncbi:NADP-dependent 3-hydroxy acid dehydrogenase YdfG [Thermocatellispora tengchongensis]|uniref:NADP-dependent 3-hydroxy acid dehydrogenase YdfG n=1 Tax=Thermocatellispora tengchongensis TaxID=1073253 RepID=A0A840P5E6_9ACTN|nr:SDR family NAD(P)-dependent oxidoreductase [Thermocatellispora tengchongensis]MBB5136534.1 NADP-dependent 3-hydroxy acid dehydrogenase YdfG [Thermocatellispora tengchongensis]
MSTVALVTGAASGIGAATARRLAAGGVSCVLVDIDGDGLERVAKEIGAATLTGDVSRPEVSAEAVALAVERYGGLDLVHLNAGVATGFDLAAEFDADLYRRATGVNIDGVVYGFAAAVPALRRRGGGAIVVTASIAGLMGYEADPVYTMTKHAVVGLVRAMAGPLAVDRIRVGAVCPGFTDTPLLGGGAKRVFVGAGFPLLTADDVAAAVESAFYAETPGTVLVVQPGRAPVPYRFAGIPGPADHRRPPVVTGEA